MNGVVQAALRCAWPGVPDLYQGAEFWDLSLVDPDNRRPVNYAARTDALDNGHSDWTTGSVKQAAIAELLAIRREHPGLFTKGALEKLPARGLRADHVLAFRRTACGDAISVAVMLHVAQAVVTLGDMPDAAWWDDTEIELGGIWSPAASVFGHQPVFYRFGV